MASAAAALGISVTILRRAKTSGAPGFRGSRVHLAEVGKWLAQHKADIGKLSGKESLQLAKLSEEVRKLKMQNDSAASVLVDKSALIAALQNAAGRWQTARLRMEAEEPSKLAGIMGVPEMAGEIRRLMDDVSGIIYGLGTEFDSL
jgi:hypothetical protein